MVLESISNWITGLIFICTFLIVWHFTSRRKGLPPGPFPLPIIGNLLYLAGQDPLGSLRDLRDKYGDIFSLSMGQSVAVFLSGYDVIHDALVKKGAHFSNRPVTLFSKKLLGKGIVYGNENIWKQNRKIAQLGMQAYGFSKTAVPMEERIHREIKEFILIIEKEGGPFDPQDLLSKAMANIIASVCVEERCNYEDPMFNFFLYSINQDAKLFTNATVLLNCFPFLQYMPGDVLKIEHMKRNREKCYTFFNNFIGKHVQAFERSSIRDFIDLYLADINEDKTGKLNMEELRCTLHDLIGAGTETSATTMRWLIIYLLNNPRIQEKLLDDIDDVIGPDRRPTLEDRQKLPYVEATILETLRMATPGPLTIPHTAKEDIVLKGFLIPRNTTIFVNIDACLKDPRIWDEPLKFQPERFLDTDGQLNVPKEFIVFSVGRRSCLGESLARMELFLFVTSLLQKFEFVAPSGTCPPKPVGRLGLTFSPLPYTVEAVCRKKN